MAADPQDLVNDSNTASENGGRGFPLAFLIGIAAVAILVALVYWFSTRQTPEVAPAALPFTETEQAYARRIRFTDIQMSRATNFLGHEITVISGFLENMGNQTLREMTFRIEFRGFSGEVVYQDELRFPEKNMPPIEGGRRREFQFNFEKIPPTWSQTHPQFHITGLALEP